jgi:predicted alpha/beta hydrolase family esterase
MKTLNIIFSHGKESGPWGSKITKMADHAKTICECEIYSLDYQDLESPDERVERLVSYLKDLKGDIILVGSSMGGYVSTVASSKVTVVGLMLLAPAFYLPDYTIAKPTTSCDNITIIHGWNDDIVPFQNSVQFAEQHKARLVLVDDGHRLSQSSEQLNHEIENIIKKRKINE